MAKIETYSDAFAEYNQQDATFHNLFLYDALHVSHGFSVHHQELKTVRLIMLPAANLADKYLMLYMQF